MQPSLPSGTLLQSRYRLLKILGQGGFGRTYLAEDQARFQERCALKEWIPLQSGTYSLAKSQELFQREAAVLYQIQHPQVPQFRALFEQDGRFFLVQDYVAGSTYRTLLQDRVQQGFVFSEAEVLQLLRDLLPVLVYIHGQGIVHRDIAPDNVMLREADHKPVLIDFGVVKELVTRLQFSHSHSPVTTVGKLGYAPIEQMQTGRTYPSSDLYALAVTAVVLLTGYEPQDLFDDTTLTWHWQALVSLQPGFTQVLTRMLSQRPSDRYPSAQEVIQALQPLMTAVPHGLAATINHGTQPPHSALSHLQTVAVGGRPQPLPQSHRVPHSPDPMVPLPSRSFWENPGLLIPTGLVVAVLSGYASWSVVNALVNQGNLSPTLQPTPMNSASPLPTLTPKASVSVIPVVQIRPLELVTGQPLSQEGVLEASAPLIYRFTATKGQILKISVDGKAARITLLDPNQELVDRRAEGVRHWQGSLPLTGQYSLQLSPAPGIAESDYQLNIDLSNPAKPTPTPTTSPSPLDPSPTPSPTPTPTLSLPPAVEYDESTVQFGGGDTAQVSGQTSRQRVKRYRVSGQEGQMLQLDIREGTATLEVRDTSGQLIPGATGAPSWQGKLSSNGDYLIDIIADQPTDFTLEISLQN
ncbi:hypothetical protein DO97_04765 [Neosynechococcus sphagnicola sy1]|uniref:non-specific serine/threonine protein kinase n=1 Tax=Neosynechococcus sphagnicola sy1 TaxID=1497020 RepID=A0A098TKH8_9CYAN|nr:serine/threonine-protein kinase [Neosynechococcus sphagnicola]KGF72794.1 hypothetical protein DO97_04765 [Neosynechococcus sphagnicola sy1]